MEAREAAPDRGMMMIKEVAPAMIAECGGFLGRANDAGKEHRGKHAVDCDGWTRAGQKLLDGIGDVAGIVTEEGDVVVPRELEIAGARNMLSERPTTLHDDVLVVRPVDDEGRDPDRRDDVADVKEMVHARVRGPHIKKRRDCPECGTGFRHLELPLGTGTTGKYRCPACHEVLEKFDGTAI